jgi:hypothetical protein
MKLLKELERDSRNKILGLLLFILALLLLVSSVSYYLIQDHAQIRAGIKAGDYSKLTEGPSNKGGIVGGMIAAFGDIAFGLCSLFIPFGLAIWGINRFFGHSIETLAKRTIVAVFFILSSMVLISLFFARAEFSQLGMTFGGAIGHFLAKWLVALVGGLVAFTLVISLIITGLIFVVPSLVSNGSKRIFESMGGLLRVIAGRFQFTRKTKARVLTETKIPNTGAIKIKKKSSSEIDADFSGDQAAVDLDGLQEPSPSQEMAEPAVSPLNRLKSTRVTIEKGSYRLPSIELLNQPPANGPVVDDSYYKKTAEARSGHQEG